LIETTIVNIELRRRWWR